MVAHGTKGKLHGAQLQFGSGYGKRTFSVARVASCRILQSVKNGLDMPKHDRLLKGHSTGLWDL